MTKPQLPPDTVHLADSLDAALKRLRGAEPVDLRPAHAQLSDLLFGHVALIIQSLRAIPTAGGGDAQGADEALGYATRLLQHFVAEHFPHNPYWKPLPDLIGVLTQLDNAITIARDYKEKWLKSLEGVSQ